MMAVADGNWRCEECKYDPINGNRFALAAVALADEILVLAS